jgi:hypothetical protein
MKVQELLDLLENCNPEAEVRFASQPNWPMEYSIKSNQIYDCEEETQFMTELDDDGDEIVKSVPKVIYLIEGKQIGYLPGWVAEEIGWR